MYIHKNEYGKGKYKLKTIKLSSNDDVTFSKDKQSITIFENGKKGLVVSNEGS